MAFAWQMSLRDAGLGRKHKFSKLDLAPNKKGGIKDMESMKKYCGTKKLKVAYSDGWGGNYWRKIARAEFEEEAAKCPNITEVRYTDGEFKAEKQIADIRGLIAQKFDVIVVFADTGVAQLKVMRQAYPGRHRGGPVLHRRRALRKNGPGLSGPRDRNADRRRPDERRVDGQDPGRQGQRHRPWRHRRQSHEHFAQAVGWRAVFAKHPGIKVLEGPVATNWDPALAQKVTAAAIAKYPKIDGIMAETTGPIRAFVAAGRPIPAWAGQDLNELSCLWQDLHKKHPTFKLATVSAHTWLVRLALRKGIAAANGMNNLEPSLIDLPFSEDSTSSNPKLKVKCDKSLPPTAIPSSMLSGAKMKAILAK